MRRLVPLLLGVWAANAAAGTFPTAALQAERQKDYRTACRHYLSALAEDPKNDALWQALRRAADNLKKAAEAQEREDLSRYVLDAERRQARAFAAQEGLRKRAAQGARLTAQGKLLEASDVFNRILEEAPGLDEARLGLQKNQRALNARLKKGRFASPQALGAGQGIFLFNQNQWGEAARTLRQSLTGAPPEELVPARLEYYAAKAEENHRRDLWAARRLELLSGAIRDEQEGKLKDAQAKLQQILANDPADAEALAALASLGAVASVVKKAVPEEAKRKEIPRLLVRGTMQAANKEFTDALTTFHEVLLIDPENAEAAEQIAEVKRLMRGQNLYVPLVAGKTTAEEQYRLGLQHYGNERMDEAREAFQKVLQLDPKHEGAKQALQRLNRKD